MTQDDVHELDTALEELLICGHLDHDQHELVERCLDQGYVLMSQADKAMIRRLLNTRHSGSKSPQQPSSPLQRWRQRRDAQSRSSAKA